MSMHLSVPLSIHICLCLSIYVFLLLCLSVSLSFSLSLSLSLLPTQQMWVLQGGGSPSVGYQVADAGHLAPGATYTTAQTVQGSDLMRYAAVGDATLLIGGDLTVTVFEVFTC